MCNCIKDISDKAFELAINKNIGGVTGGHFVQINYPIRNGNIRSGITYSDFEYTFVPVKKDGTNGRPRRGVINLNHTFCPFCGEEYPD